MQRLEHSLDTSEMVVKRLSKLSESQANGEAAAKMSAGDRQREKTARESIVLWRKPLTTLSYFFHELFLNIYEYGQQLV